MRHTAYKGEGDESGGSSGAWGFARESAMSASAITLRVSIAFQVANWEVSHPNSSHLRVLG